MSMVGSFTKQPDEVLDYAVDYKNWLERGDTLESAQVTMEPDTSLTVRAVFVRPQAVTVWLAGGAHGTSCKMTVTATTRAGRVKQDEVKFKVKEI